MTIKLTLREMAEVRRRARARQSANEADDRPTLKMQSNVSDEHIHMVGAFCEMVIEKATGQKNNCVVHQGGGFREATNQSDVGEWEIKGTELVSGRLLVPLHLKHKHDRKRKYVLVYANLVARQGTIRGWAYGHEFIGVEAYITYNVPRPAYYMPVLRRWER